MFWCSFFSLVFFISSHRCDDTFFQDLFDDHSQPPPLGNYSLSSKFYDIHVSTSDQNLIKALFELISEGHVLAPDRIAWPNLTISVTEKGLSRLRSISSPNLRIVKVHNAIRKAPQISSRGLSFLEIDWPSALPFLSSSPPASDFFSDYHRYDKIMDFLVGLTHDKVNSKYVSLELIGKSTENRDLVVIKISKPSSILSSSKRTKPIIWIDAGIHAREWIAPSTALFLAYKLVANPANERDVDDLLNFFDFHIMPLFNPDGYEYSHTTERLWRKTRSRHSSNDWCVGVDANRNFEYKWMVEGASSNPCSEIYAGPVAFSEPETAAMRDYFLRFISGNTSRIMAYLTLHSFGEMWVYPWGWTGSVVPDNLDSLREKAKVAIAAMGRKSVSNYKYGTSGGLLYPAAGGSDDWAMAVGKVPYAYTVELSPNGGASSQMGFGPLASSIKPVGEEIFKAVRAFAFSLLNEVAELKVEPRNLTQPTDFDTFDI